MICEEETVKHLFRYSSDDWTTSSVRLEHFRKVDNDIEVTLLVELEYFLSKSLSSIFELNRIGVSDNTRFERTAKILSFEVHNDPNQHINRKWSKDGDSRILIKDRKSSDDSPLNSDFISYRIVALLKALKPEDVKEDSEDLESILRCNKFKLIPKSSKDAANWGKYHDLKSPYGSWEFTDTLFQEISTYKHSNVVTLNKIAFYHFTGCTLTEDDPSVLEKLQIYPTKDLTFQVPTISNDDSTKYNKIPLIISYTGDVFIRTTERPLTILPFNVSFYIASK